MIDADFIDWIADRMINVYGENEYYDFVIRLRQIAKEMREKKP